MRFKSDANHEEGVERLSIMKHTDSAFLTSAPMDCGPLSGMSRWLRYSTLDFKDDAGPMSCSIMLNPVLLLLYCS